MDGYDERLFSFVAYEVLSAGGDGDGVVIIRDGKASALADVFVDWMTTDLWFSENPWARSDDSEDQVVFSEGQQNIIFLSGEAADKFSLPWKPDVRVEVCR